MDQLMLGRIGRALLWGVGCYVVAVMVTYFLISQFSRNTHDRSMEAGMTAFFIIGPLAAIVGGSVAFVRHKPA